MEASGSEAAKYWAFISYSHADSRWAQWLHKALEGYRIPARLIGRATAAGPVPRRLFPVFRDRDELAGSAELGGALQKALRESRFQIVICSPRAAQSRWVNEEIRYFKSLGRGTRVLALIVDGEPNASDAARECFPEALRFHVDPAGTILSQPAEQVAADARAHGDGKHNALLKLIAGILGIGLDDLRQRDLQARNRRLAVLAGVATAVSAVTLVLAVMAVQARDDALRRQQQAEDLLQFMLGDLREKLEPIGKLAILDAVGKKAMDYFATLDVADVSDAALASRAKALRQIGEVRAKQGDMAGASEAFLQALAQDQALEQRHPEDAETIHHVAQSEFSVGLGHYLRGEFDAARQWFERTVASLERALALRPDDPDWARERADGLAALGAVEYQARNYGAAQKAYDAALLQAEALLEANPGNVKLIASVADVRSGLWGVKQAVGEIEASLQQARMLADLRRQRTALEPENVPFKNDLAAANLLVLYTESQLRPVLPDDPVLRETIAVTESLATLDPENVEYGRNRLIALNYLVDAHLLQDHAKAADAPAQDMLASARDLYRRAPASAAAIDDLLAALNQSAQLALLQDDSALARQRLQEAAQLPLTPEQQKASSPSRWLDHALLAWWLDARSDAAASLQANAGLWIERMKSAGATVKPEQMLRYELLRGDAAAAASWFGRLSALERSHPFLKRFCRDLRGCPAPAATP